MNQSILPDEFDSDFILQYLDSHEDEENQVDPDLSGASSIDWANFGESEGQCKC